jgi:hypothetical protein
MKELYSAVLVCDYIGLHTSLILVSFAVTVVGANLCTRDPLDVKGKGIRGVGGVTDKEAYCPYDKHYFPTVICNLLSFPMSVMCLVFTVCFCFPSTRKLVT